MLWKQYIYIFVFNFFKLCACGHLFNPLIQLILFGEMAVNLLPFREAAVISCFLSFIHLYLCFWYSQNISSSPLKKDDFISPLMKDLVQETWHVLHRGGGGQVLLSSPLCLCFCCCLDQGWPPPCWKQQHSNSVRYNKKFSNNSKVLSSSQSTWCMWFRSHLGFGMSGFQLHHCFLVPCWHPWQNRRSRV